MPGSGRRWRGGRSEGACPRRIDRFLEPCLLLLLHCNEAHGYELLDWLKPFGFEENPVDLSTVYRVLRGLEEQGHGLLDKIIKGPGGIEGPGHLVADEVSEASSPLH